MPILKQIYINYVSLVYHESYFVNLYHVRPEIKDGKYLLSDLHSPPANAKFFFLLSSLYLNPLSTVICNSSSSGALH